jgi:hypothetical protein
MDDPEEHLLRQLILENGSYLEVVCQTEVVMVIPPQVRVGLQKVW